MNLGLKFGRIPQMGNCEQERHSEVRMPLSLPFYFDPEKMLFVVGPQEFQQTFDPSKIESVFEMEWKMFDSRIKIEPEAEESLVLGRSDLIQLGFLRKKLAEIFLDDNKREMINDKVIDVMRKIYKKVAPEITLPGQRGGGGHILFNSQFNKKGIFYLQTFGDCACLGRDPTEDLVYPCNDTDLSLPLVYGLHNVDTRAKMMSLYAGAGTLAFLAKRDFRDLEVPKLCKQQAPAKQELLRRQANHPQM